MSQYVIIQINTDHLEDARKADNLDPDANMWDAIDEAIRDVYMSNVKLREWGLHRLITVIGATGNPLRAEDIKQYWLAKPSEVNS